METPTIGEARWLSRAGRHKAIYVAVVWGSIIFTIATLCGCLGRYGWASPVLLVAAVALITAHRVVPYFWTDLVAACDHAGAGRYAEAKMCAERFIADLQRRPALRKLQRLFFNVYSRDPRAQALNILGAAEHHLGEFDFARSHLEEAIKRDPDFPLPYYNMGSLVMDTGTVQDGGSWLWRAGELGFRRRMAHFMWNLTSIIPPNPSFGRAIIKPTGDHVVELLNDDSTDLAFVLSTLEQVFGMTGRQAMKTAHETQESGTAPIGSFSPSEAKAKAEQLHALAREAGFPLQCRIKGPGSSPWLLAPQPA